MLHRPSGNGRFNALRSGGRLRLFELAWFYPGGMTEDASADETAATEAGVASPQQINPPTWPTEMPAGEEAAAALNDLALDTLDSTMGIYYSYVAADRVEASMRVAGNTQPYGLLHGGASGVLAESAGSLAASMHAGNGRIAVGIELSCSHHRSATKGEVHAVATPLSLGRTLATYEIRITDDDARPVCTARLTCLLRDV